MINEQSNIKKNGMVFVAFFPFIIMAFLMVLYQIDKVLTEPPEEEEKPCFYDGVLETGATYYYGNFVYKYKQEKIWNDWIDIPNYVEGWGVSLNNEYTKEPITSEGYCNDIRGIPIVSMSYMFEGSQAEYIDMTGFDTSEVINMQGMFANTMAKTLNLKDMNTSKVTNMSNMFYWAMTSSLDLTSFDTSSVIDMQDMFAMRPYYTQIHVYVKNNEEYNRLINSPGKSSNVRISIGQ